MAREGSEAVRALADALRDVPRELRPQVRKALKSGGEGIRARAAQEASWSRRIPRSLRVRTRFGGTRAGVYVTASRLAAPQARPFEGITGNAEFRHPVPGTGRWVSQKVRPFLAPAVGQQADRAMNEVKQALDDALRGVGLI